MSKKIKILIVTTVKIGYDGLTNHILTYIKNMDKKDLEIDLVSARGIDDKIKTKLEDTGFNNIYRLEYRDTNQFNYFNDLRHLIKKNRYDILHAHGNSATLAVEMLAGFLGGCKIRIAHSHNSSCEHKVFNMLLKPLFRLFYTEAFACSKEAGKWLFGNKDFKIIPNGIEVEKYRFNNQKRKKYRELLNIDEDCIALGNVAAFVEKKNHRFIVDVFSDLLKSNNKYKMYLFGIEGESLNKVKKQINKLNLNNNIFIMGTKDNINDYLQAMDIMLLPSIYEGFPISVIEWQACGLPCILSKNITQDTDIIGNVYYLPIDKGIEPWKNKILEMKIDEKRRDFYSIKRIFIERGFDIKNNAEFLRNLYIQYKERKYV